MSKDFLAKLRRIKQASQDQAAAGVAAQRAAEDARREMREKYYDLHERLVEALDEALDGFCQEFEGFRKQTSYLGEDYVMAVSYDEVVLVGTRDVSMTKYLSQLTFTIRGMRDSGFFAVHAKTVLRNKEHGTRTWDDRIDRADRESVIEFAQNEVLRFAQRFTARAALAEND